MNEGQGKERSGATAVCGYPPTGSGDQSYWRVLLVRESQRTHDAGNGKGLMDGVSDVLCARRCSRRSYQSCSSWIKRFMIFHHDQILIRRGKGTKGRITELPKSLNAPLLDHLKKVKTISERDMAGMCIRVLPTGAFPSALKEWRWQCVIPQEDQRLNPQKKEQAPHLTGALVVQKVLRATLVKADLAKRATYHTFRHSFATKSRGVLFGQKTKALTLYGLDQLVMARRDHDQ